MLPPEQPDRIDIAFDDHRLVANAGLLLPVVLAHYLDLGELVYQQVNLGDAPGRANAGDTMLMMAASAKAFWSRPWATPPSAPATPSASATLTPVSPCSRSIRNRPAARRIQTFAWLKLCVSRTSTKWAVTTR